MSTNAHIERRLAAVAFADVAGFSRLIEQDDVETTRKWRTLREDLLAPKIAEHFGRLVRMIGDGLLIEFRSVVDAVVWARDVQRAIDDAREDVNETLLMRIAINVEDVVVDGDDLYGDGVNIAARIQQLAKPGEVVVTSTVNDYVRNKLGVTFTDLGDHELKNISRPIRIFRLDPSKPETGEKSRDQPFLAWTNRPSIAVLPFENLGGNPEEGYFGEGITEEIIAALARNRSLLVIARHSTLRYADRRADIRQIASELGVRYVLSGNVRRQALMLRISAELIDASQNRTMWADRFDGMNEDLFEFQSNIASSIVSTIEPRLVEAEAHRAPTKPTESLDAYDCFLRALALLYSFNKLDFHDAGRYLDRAIEIDPGYAQAYAYKAWWYNLAVGEGISTNTLTDVKSAETCAQRAVNLDPSDSLAHAVGGHIQAFLLRRPEIAVAMFERALQLNPNSAFAWGVSASTYCFLGRPEDALERLRNASRLSPYDPMNFFFWTVAGIAEFVAGRQAQAVPWLQKARRENPRFLATLRTLAASLALLARDEEARMVARDLLAADPSFRISVFASWYPLRRTGDLDRLVTGLQLAGLPD